MTEDGDAAGGRAPLRACLELTKPGITGFVVMSAGVGFLLGAEPGWSLGAAHLEGRLADLVLTLLGTALAAGGTNALNQWLERDADGRMRRTRSRPLPAGRLSPPAGLGFGLALAVAGPAVLLLVDAVAAVLAALTVLLYDLVYTPMKRRTWFATIVGGVPGALPVLGGWQAAAGGLGREAWILFAVLFLWQLPHFFSLDWMLREDYRRGGFRTLAADRPDGTATAVAAVAAAVALAASATLPWAAGGLGPSYGAGAAALGAGLVALAVPLGFRVSAVRARRLFVGTLLYLPAIYGLLLLAASAS